MVARVAPQGLRGVAGDGGARLGQARHRPDRLPGDQLLGGAEAEAGPRQHGRRRPRDPRHVRQARHPAARAEDAEQRRRRRDRRLGVGDHHVQGDARRGRRDLLLVLRGGPRPPRAGARAPRLGRAGTRQLLRRAQLGGLLRRIVLLHPQGRALPDGAVDLLPHQLAEHRPVRAHADRRRGRLARVATSKAAPRRSATRTSCTPPSSSSWPRTAPRSSTRRCRTGTRATRTASAASTTSSPSAARAHTDAKISWTQVETGSAITWKYPSVHPAGRPLGRRVLLGRAVEQAPAGRHRHEDDPHRQGHDAARSSPRASRPATARTPTAGSSRCCARPRTPATTPSATRC